MMKLFILLIVSILQFNCYANTTYKTICIRCHNANPTLKGSIGPELYTTPKEVFYTKVPQGKYPDGYKAKRPTKIMPKFKLTTEQIDGIVKYVKEFNK